MNTPPKTASDSWKDSTSSSDKRPRTLKVARTKTGAPCLWESISTFDNGLERATLIVDSEGRVKTSVFHKKSSEKQALVPIQEGDVIVKAFKDAVNISISLLQVQEISSMKNEAQVFPIYRGTVEDQFPENFKVAIEKAIEKLNTKSVYSALQFSIPVTPDGPISITNVETTQ